MPPSQRAKIFNMFDALKGLKEALAAMEKQPEPRRYLTEDAIAELNSTLVNLRKGQMITVVYYCLYQQEICQLTGAVVKVDSYWNTLQMGDVCISFEEIYGIHMLDE